MHLLFLSVCSGGASEDTVSGFLGGCAVRTMYLDASISASMGKCVDGDGHFHSFPMFVCVPALPALCLCLFSLDVCMLEQRCFMSCCGLSASLFSNAVIVLSCSVGLQAGIESILQYWLCSIAAASVP